MVEIVLRFFHGGWYFDEKARIASAFFAPVGRLNSSGWDYLWGHRWSGSTAAAGPSVESGNRCVDFGECSAAIPERNTAFRGFTATRDGYFRDKRNSTYPGHDRKRFVLDDR